MEITEWAKKLIGINVLKQFVNRVGKLNIAHMVLL